MVNSLADADNPESECTGTIGAPVSLSKPSHVFIVLFAELDDVQHKLKPCAGNHYYLPLLDSPPSNMVCS